MKRRFLVNAAAGCLVLGMAALLPFSGQAAEVGVLPGVSDTTDTADTASQTEAAAEVVSGNVSADTEISDDEISAGVHIGDVDVSGMTLEAATQAVKAAVEAAGNTKITLKADDATTEVTAADFGLTWANPEVVEEALNLGKSGNAIKRYKDTKDLQNEAKTLDITYSTDKDKIKSTIKAKESDLNRDAVAASLTHVDGVFQVASGQDGIEVNVKKSAKIVASYMDSDWDGSSTTIELKADTTKAEEGVENLELVKDVLGTATTYYGSTYERNMNVENGTAKVSDHLILPGETFSVTQALVPFTAENGYEPAPSYESGQVVDTYGGGICQVSTTLYNAVLKAELNVVERHNHTMIVTYVDPSKDAAIAEGLMDFQFSNNTDAPIYIEGSAYGGELTFTIYGHETRDPNRTVEYVSETTGTTEPEGVQLIADSEQSVGYLEQTQSAHQGSTAVLWKYVTENGETTQEQVNSSTYQAVPVTYKVGTNTSDANVLAALQTAIANNDLTSVQAIISGSYGTTTDTTQTDGTQTETYQTDTTQTEAYQTDSYQTDAYQTEAPVTEAPQTDAPQQEVYDPPEDPSYTDGSLTDEPVYIE